MYFYKYVQKLLKNIICLMFYFYIINFENKKIILLVFNFNNFNPNDIMI